ncbi:myosin-16-like [Mycteria americana]|uniref:myosin-16-like n=1 Tax=Mycteria americana TaxID=33587 RepID=UPI003F58C65E
MVSLLGTGEVSQTPARPKSTRLDLCGEPSESLEDQIIQVNPVLDTLDNAETARKNNSSRFKLLLVPNPNNYHWVHQGVITADNTHDGEEALLTNVILEKRQ